MSTKVKALRAVTNRLTDTLNYIDGTLIELYELVHRIERKAAMLNVEAKLKALDIASKLRDVAQRRMVDAAVTERDARQALWEAELELKAVDEVARGHV